MSFLELGWKWMSFLSFVFSVIAAVLAIDMYKLSRTGRFGVSWRVLITATVIYALLQVSHLAENVRPVFAVFSHVVELVFVLALAYAFYLQRQIFRNASHLRDESEQSSHTGHERRQRSLPYHGPERRRTAQTAAAHEATPVVETENDDAEDEDTTDDIEWQTPRIVAR